MIAIARVGLCVADRATNPYRGLAMQVCASTGHACAAAQQSSIPISRYDHSIMDAPAPRTSRPARQKARTRGALIEAAKTLFAAEGSTDVSIQEITDAADVGFGSFYNHFSTKAELFDAAIDATFEEHAAWLDELLKDEADPAVVFAMSLRLSGRLVATNPKMAQVMMNATGRLLGSKVGMAPRALRDIRNAAAAGRFEVSDPQVGLACAAGALVGVLHLLAANPELDVASVTDEMTYHVLRMFGMTRAEATAMVALPLSEARGVKA